MSEKRPNPFPSTESKRSRRNPIISAAGFFTACAKIMNEVDISDKDFEIPDLKYPIQQIINNTEKLDFQLYEDKVKLPQEVKQHALMKIDKALVSEIDLCGNLDRKFSYEAYKYYMASYENKVNIQSFRNSNNIKTKNTTINKDTMYEFSKSPSHFLNFIPKMNDDDIKMYKFIIENELKYPKTHYSFISSFPEYNFYKNEDFDMDNPLYIPINTTVRSYIVVTKNVKILYDGQIISIPSCNVEKSIKFLENPKSLTKPGIATKFTKLELDDSDYVVFDVTNDNNTLTVIDIIDSNFIDLSENYMDRLNFCAQEFVYPVYSINYDETNKNSIAGSYIKKQSIGLKTSCYLFTKVLIPAVVGIQNNRALLAFYDGDQELVLKGCSDMTNTNIFLEQQEIEIDPILHNAHSEYSFYNITLNGMTKKLFTREKNFKLFKKAIPFTLENNKLEARSNLEISNVNEYKLSKKEKDNFKIDDILTERDGDLVLAKIKNSPFYNYICKKLNLENEQIDISNL